LSHGRYETAFQILHKLRAGMVRPDRDRIGGETSAPTYAELYAGDWQHPTVSDHG
jgi:hypothetical protein